MDVGLSLARRARPRRDRLTAARQAAGHRHRGASRPPNYTPRHGPPLGVRAPRRHRGRRLPGRPRAHGHRGRAAVDPGRPGRSEQRIRLDRAAQGELDHQRLPAGLHPDHADGRPAGRPVGRPAAVHGRARGLHVRVGAGRCCPVARPAHRGTARPGGRWRRARPGRDGRRLASVRWRDATAGAGRRRRADLPRDGRRTGRRGGHHRLGPPGGRAGRGGRRRRGDRRSSRPPGAGCSTSTSRSASSP